jgi:membrane-bound metal-dependent hydrolase YbcI (DUF457 family)
MDFASHAVAGAVTGLHYGKPVTGAVLAVLPDLVLGIKRRALPNGAYNFTHSLLFLAVGTALGYNTYMGAQLAFFAIGSHILLDLPTHGSTWAPCLLWPSKRRFSMGSEWEFFSPSWYFGLFLLFVWVFIWSAI